ncbi:transposon, En/Spm-like, transposase-associated domain protein [Tanacetum coccineum]
MKGSCYNEGESDYCEELEEVIEVDYHSMLGTCMVVLFKCRWFDLVQGVKVNVKHKLVDIKYRSRRCIYDPFILAYQVQQVHYETCPSMTKDLKDWWAVMKAMPRGILQVAEGILSTEISSDDNVDGDDFFQENDRLVCTIGTTEDIQPVTLVREEIEVVQPVLLTHDTNYDGEEEEFEDTNGDIDLDSS